MSVPALNWRTVTGARSDRFFVKHTRLAVAFYHGHRFAIYEIRGARNTDGSFNDYYVVADAHTVSDADIAAGRSAAIVHRTTDLDLPGVIAWCDAQTQGTAA
jgi:hypothetical protein